MENNSASEDQSLEDWDIDVPRQLATHRTGLIVELIVDPLYNDKWSGRCLNARSWAEEDFARRAPLIPKMLGSAITAFQSAYRAACAGR